MDQFYMIVLGAIGVLLILMLTAVGLLMYSAKAKPEAPLRSPCPDYWQFDGSGCLFPGNTGVNVGTLLEATISPSVSSAQPINTSIYYGTSSPSPAVYRVNPNSTKWSSLYSGMTEVCAKGKWARDLGIVWDGYTNTTEC